MNKQNLNCYINFPSMREELINHIKDLTNKKFQKEKWFSNQNQYIFWWEISMTMDFMEDIGFRDDFKGQADIYIKSIKEFDIINSVLYTLDTIIDVIGPNQKDEAYWTSPLWDQVVEAAQEAYKVFKHNDEICENMIKQELKPLNYQIDFPIIRQTLIDIVRKLYYQDDQRELWITDQSPYIFWQQISQCIKYLSDDLNFKLKDKSQLKAFIRSEKEFEAIQTIFQAFEELKTIVGENKEWNIYWESPLWWNVGEAAQHAYNMFICHDEFCRKMNERRT